MRRTGIRKRPTGTTRLAPEQLEDRWVPAPFTAGDLVVVRIGGTAAFGAGASALTSAATATFIDEFNTSGARQQTIALPTTPAGTGNGALTNGGTATTEGSITLSSDMQYLQLGGYNASVGTLGVAGGSDPRIIGRIGIDGNVDTSTRPTGLGTATIRGAASIDGTAFWTVASNGVGYVPFTGSSSTTLTTTNSRVISVQGAIGGSGNQLYVSTSASIFMIGTGTPTSGSPTAVALTLPSLGTNIIDYIFLDRDASVPGVDSLWVADQTTAAGIKKYSFDGSAWALRGTQTGVFTGLEVAANGTGFDIYATNGTAPGNTLVKFSDTAAYNVAASFGSITVLATAPANTVFRGLSFTPQAATTAPSITTQPSDSTITAGANTTFTAAATGSPTPTVQWQVSTNGGTSYTDLANAGVYSGVITNTLTITGATAGLGGNLYRAVYTNSVGTATTNAATLTVNVAPAITTQPTDATVTAGGNTSFTAAASGSPTPTAQWQISTNGGTSFSNLSNAGVYSGVTTNTLTITGATAGLSGNQYRAVYTNSVSTATTNAATLTVNVSPAITTQPSDSTITAGANTTFTAAASGSPTPTAQWQVSTNGGSSYTNLANAGVYTGVTTNILTITGATAGLSGNLYRTVYTNAAGSATTSAATLTVNTTPTITTQPTDSTITAGANTTFAAAANGSPTPTAQWQISTNGGTSFSNLSNAGVYSGVTTNTLTITGATAGLSGNQYRAVYTNSVSTATTNAAILTVNVAPAITTQPSDSTITAGANATFTAAASGSPTPTAQWQVSTNGGASYTNLSNAGVYSGVATNTLTISAATAGLSGNLYRAVYTNAAGAATTNAATLTVNFAPSVTTQPSDTTVNAGANTTFTAAASGNPTPTVVWQISTNGGASFSNLSNAGVYTGVTTDTLIITGATAGLSGNQYRAVYTNTVGTANTNAATLTVNVAPTITTQPTDRTINEGTNTTFTAAASGSPAPTVQWQASTNGGASYSNLANAGVYSGVTTNTLTITAATLSLSGTLYRAVYTNVAGSATTNPTSLTVNAATVTAITRVGTSPTNSGTVSWTVTFSLPVSGVTASNFTLTDLSNSITGEGVTNATPVGGAPATQWTVSASTGSAGDGTLRLVVNNAAGISPTVTGLPLSVTTADYVIDKTAPLVSSVIRASTNPTNSNSVTYTVTFGEDVNAPGTGAFSFTTTGSVAGAVVNTVTAVDAHTYTISVGTGTGNGTLRMNVLGGSVVTDLAGNQLAAAYTSGEIYTILKTAPTVATTSPANGSVVGPVGYAGSVSGTAANALGATVASVTATIRRSSDSLYWTGSTWGSLTNLAAAVVGTNWSVNFPAAVQATGITYTITAIATDTAGNVGTATPVAYQWDGTPPAATIILPNDVYGPSTWAGAVGGSVSDTGAAGVSAVNVVVSRASDGFTFNATTQTWDSGTFTNAVTPSASA